MFRESILTGEGGGLMSVIQQSTGAVVKRTNGRMRRPVRQRCKSVIDFRI